MSILKLIRVHQWTKNLFVFAPLFFSGQFLDKEKLVLSALGFLCFCLAASSIYIINDLFDAEKDKLHPTKKNRPIASGKISKSFAIILFLLFITSALSVSFFINKGLFVVILIYFVLNLLYSFGLKQISLIDIFIVSLGFVLRVAAGGTLTEIPVSHWLYIMTFLLALFIAMAKRRDDVLILNETGSEMRKSVKGYNLEFISSAISILCAVLVVSYLLYITSPEVVARFEGKHPYISTLFVILGVFRYLQITLVQSNSGSPSKILLKDLFIQSVLVLWVLFFITIIYFI
ncbi:MAG: decaprenyl-phosphate phosphoribosyltransferase [Bacteroidota bacterium]|nr:decaprenyl-phosphate phosphoribosyltransferase [Bacteroidota bacterium]